MEVRVFVYFVVSRVRDFYKLMSRVWKISIWESGNIGNEHIGNTRARARLHTIWSNTINILMRAINIAEDEADINISKTVKAEEEQRAEGDPCNDSKIQ